MKRILLIVFTTTLLIACGSSDTKESSDNDSSELTIEEENELATSLVNEIQGDTEEVKKTTEENLEEIDSLLENFE